MRKWNKILVPSDFSEESARALRYALSLVSTRPRRDRGVELHFSPGKPGNPGRGFRHRFSQSLIVRPT